MTERKKPELYENSIGARFVKVEPGEFIMGSDKNDNEKPAHKVKITKPYYMMDAPVTQRLWMKVMGNNPSKNQDDLDAPVETVSWNDAQEFIKKLNEMEGTDGYSLPTEAEWEYACRAGSTTDYCYGDDPSIIHDWAVIGNSIRKVRSLLPNNWGLYDMHGNVWEWCLDEYDSKAYQKRESGVKDPFVGDPSLLVEPKGPFTLKKIEVEGEEELVQKNFDKFPLDKPLEGNVAMIHRIINNLLATGSLEVDKRLTATNEADRIGLCTDEVDKQKVEELIAKYYQMKGLEVPKFEWAMSPKQAALRLNELTGKDIPYYVSYMLGQGEIEWWLNKENLTDEEQLRLEIAKESYWWYPLSNTCVCVERPKTIRIEDGEFNRPEGGPAIEFRDGTGFYIITNMIAPEWLVETPAEEITAEQYIKEESVDLKRLILQKVGMERLVEAMDSRVIDKDTMKSKQAKYEDGKVVGFEEVSHTYELLEVRALENRVDKALKMESASLPGVYHIEFVAPECKTVKEAHKYRYGTEEFPEQLT